MYVCMYVCTYVHTQGGKYAYAQANAKIDGVLTLASQSLDLKLLKMECLMGLNQYEEAFSFSNNLMRAQATNNLLFWRAKCLYQMVGR